MTRKALKAITTGIALCSIINSGCALIDTKPTPERPKAKMGLLAPTGRPVETYSWQSDRGGEKHNMIVIKPAKPVKEGEKIPLFVVLHGGGMGITGTYRWEAMPIDDVHKCDICYVPEDFYGLLVEVRTQDDWWGIPKNPEYTKNPRKSKSSDVVIKPIPQEKSETEKRVLEQVEWVASNFEIDRNRIYLGGASMGGSGTLGLGLPNGDIFAAVKANVSATPYHGVTRLGLNGKLNPVPDPPILVEYSSQNDIWSVDKDMLYNGMDKARYAYYAYWGAYGHSGRNSRVLPKVDLVGSFNIFDIKLDQPYVAFSKGTTNDPLPWPDGHMNAKHPLGTTSGQCNAYYRWQNVVDTADKFQVELRLLTPAEWESKHFTFPKKSSADVTLRRIANFDINAGEKLACNYNGKKFEVVADKTGHVTIPQLEMVAKPRRLTLTRILPRTGTPVQPLVRPEIKPGKGQSGISLGDYIGEFITVDGLQKPDEVADIAAILREPFKSNTTGKDKFNCPLVVVHSDNAYRELREGGDELVPEGSWALFVEGGKSAKSIEKNRIWKDCAIKFAKKITKAKTVEVLDRTPAPKK